MTCRETGRRPRVQRIIVAPGPSPVWGTFSEEPVNRSVVDSPKVKPGCTLTALAILGCSAAIMSGFGYLVLHAVRVVWS